MLDTFHAFPPHACNMLGQKDYKDHLSGSDCTWNRMKRTERERSKVHTGIRRGPSLSPLKFLSGRVREILELVSKMRKGTHQVCIFWEWIRYEVCTEYVTWVVRTGLIIPVVWSFDLKRSSQTLCPAGNHALPSLLLFPYASLVFSPHPNPCA